MIFDDDDDNNNNNNSDVMTQIFSPDKKLYTEYLLNKVRKFKSPNLNPIPYWVVLDIQVQFGSR